MYWGLRRYDHVPSVHAARQEVVAMGASLMRLNWNLFHQVCENTNGIVGICEDVGNADPFYRESIEAKPCTDASSYRRTFPTVNCATPRQPRPNHDPRRLGRAVRLPLLPGDWALLGGGARSRGGHRSAATWNVAGQKGRAQRCARLRATGAPSLSPPLISFRPVSTRPSLAPVNCSHHRRFRRWASIEMSISRLKGFRSGAVSH
jgi:hypothetical protein